MQDCGNRLVATGPPKLGGTRKTDQVDQFEGDQFEMVWGLF